MNIFIAHISGTIAELTPEESWHCSKVLRYKPGQTIKLIDGKGNFYSAELNLIHEKKCTAIIISGPEHQQKHPYYLHLGIAPTKNMDRIEWLVEKAVEIGIDEITFIRCKNSERINIKDERLIKIAESAVKQSLQAYLPKINSICNFELLLHSQCDLKFIAHCEDSSKQTFQDFDLKNKSSLVLIGPEGDFNLDEINLALQHKFIPITLGENRLRTETAGIYTCASFSQLT